MAVNKSFNGTTYSIPTTAGENGWTNLTNFLQALADYAAVKTTKVQAIRTATTSPITVSATSDFAVNVALSVAGVSTVTLPVGASGQMFCIIDGNGDSATYNITVQGSSSQTINGASTYVMTSNKQAAIFQFNGTEWKVITEYPGATLRVSKGGTGLTAVGSALQVLRTNAGATALEWATAGSGDVVGPASSTDNAIARFDGTTGKLVQNSQYAIVDDNGAATFGDSVTGSSITHNFHSTAGSKPVINANVIGTNECRIDLSRDGTRKWSWGTDNATDSMYFYNATITGLQISSSGAVTLGPSGSTATNCAVNGAASVTHGVVFPASQNAVANANTLDDYEEGTFTPTLTASVTNPTNYGQNGRYTKIGNLVHVEIYITFDGTSTFGSGIYAIGGLPFTPAATHAVIGWGLLFKFGSGWYEATMEVPAGGSSGNLIYTQTNSYVTHANPNTWNSGTYFKYQFTYRVA